jgi:hypothetical protein
MSPLGFVDVVLDVMINMLMLFPYLTIHYVIK